MTSETIAYPSPDDSPLWKPFWNATEQGKLLFLRCKHCGNAFLPARFECPNCLTPDPVWESASGRGRLISWVVYHKAPDPAFAARVPYTVAVIELEEGARMISNVVGIDDPESLTIDQNLVLDIQREDGVAVPRFTPAT